jgi:hypothetical protein
LGIDAEERNKRMVEATAARVGFKLPQTSRGSTGSPAVSQQQQQQQQGREMQVQDVQQ